MFLPLILIFAVFYFLLIRPQKKKEQQRRELLDQVRKGDKVVTIGGIIGEISSLTDREVVLRLEDNTKIRITRSAVSKIIGAEENE
ncbi:MAG: preprotein translocase subunit YajC [Planctomycetes bacterium]|nr:preprotein translocase subunit YajC [Planctomycetota bacterium]